MALLLVLILSVISLVEMVEEVILFFARSFLPGGRWALGVVSGSTSSSSEIRFLVLFFRDSIFSTSDAAVSRSDVFSAKMAFRRAIHSKSTSCDCHLAQDVLELLNNGIPLTFICSST